jgi:hypothetical protein
MTRSLEEEPVLEQMERWISREESAVDTVVDEVK